AIADYTGNQFGIGVANGSDALFIALKALGIGKGDAVICPTFSFFASAGSIVRAEGMPIFAEIDPESYSLDLGKLQQYIDDNCYFDSIQKRLIHKVSGKTIKAIMPVHLFGRMCEMEQIMEISGRYHLKVVEDAAQSIGAEYNGKKSGSFGDLAIFSFFPTKSLATYGDGGMIVTNHRQYADYCSVFRAHGARPKYFHQSIGINSRLDELHAAILNVKLKYLDQWLEARFQAAVRYEKLFENYHLIDKVRLPLRRLHFLKNHKEHTFHQYVISVNHRDELQKYLKENGIGTNVYYPLPLHLQECFAYLGYQKGDFPVSEDVSRHVLAIPMFPELTSQMQEYVVNKINQFYNDHY
ncbi:MAG: DegT/DnrJ/EryC1/StrS family aminotransferase, partial [Candidatus Atribacteria bacterium]|nr:DegT/DnrJ/EryC1/StrS family aminotransferase [Candidatus Atribacteria bacterium]